MAAAADTATEIKATADSLGWNLNVRGDLLTIEKNVANRDEFCRADAEYYTILGKLPRTRPGSMWGTDGGGVGALSVMNGGTFRMNVSGGSKRVLNALRKII